MTEQIFPGLHDSTTPPPNDRKERHSWVMFASAGNSDKWRVSSPKVWDALFDKQYIKSALFWPMYVGFDDFCLYYLCFPLTRIAQDIPKWHQATSLLMKDPTTVAFRFGFLFPHLLHDVGSLAQCSYHHARKAFLDARPAADAVMVRL